MNKAVLWLIVLVVVIGGVIFFARGKGGGEKIEDNAKAPTERPGFGETTYQIMADRCAEIDTEFGRNQYLSQQNRFRCSGVGTVVSVEQVENGYVVHIDMDGDIANGAEVTADVPATRMGVENVAEGDKVKFNGGIIRSSYDGVPILELRNTTLTTP
jgi:hypothetical protein